MFKRHVLDKLSSYLDQQVSERQRAKIERHLSGCDICSQELAKLKLVSEKVKSWHVSGLPNEFDGSVTNKIVQMELERGQVKMNKKFFPILIPSTAIAAILMFLIVGQLFVKRDFPGRGKLVEREDKVGSQQYQDAKVSAQVYGMDKGYPINGTTLDAQRSIMSKHGQEEWPVSGGYFPKEEYYAAGASQLAYPQPTITPGGPVIVVPPVLPATAEGKQVIRTAQIRLEVQDGQESYKKASAICQELGGYVSDSRFYEEAEGRQYGSITVRIPKDKFDLALEKFGSLGKVEDINTNSQDVSQEYANLTARLDTSMIVYQKMLDELQKRNVKIDEAVKLENELGPIRAQIEQIKNQIEYLNNMVSFTTITLNFHEAAASLKALKDSKRIIKEQLIATSINAVKLAAAAIPVVVVGLLWVIVGLIVFLVVKYFLRKLFKRG